MISVIYGSRFDSILDLSSIRLGHHANLVIHMKVCFQQFAPPNGRAQFRYEQSDDEHSSNIIISEWSGRDDWPGWCRRFEREAEDFFHGKIWLVPDQPWLGNAPVAGSGGRRIFRPGVRCGFRISRVSMSNCHYIVDVARTADDSDAFRSYQDQFSALRVTRRAARGAVGLDNSPENLSTIYRACVAGTGRMMLTHSDLDSIPHPRFGTVCNQRPFLHEIGHAIGLDHVNGASNSLQAYGANAYQSGDLMGCGERIEPWHSFPWHRRLGRHLRASEGPSSWSASTTRPVVPIDRVYPAGNSSFQSGGVGAPALDGGVASGCGVRGDSQNGPEGVLV